LKNQEVDARISIQNYYNCTDINQIDKIIIEMRDNLTINSKSMSIINLWSDINARRATLVGCTVAFGMAFSGIAGK